MSATYVISVAPVPKPRMTRRDKWAQRPAVLAYRAFADNIRAECQRAGFALPDSGVHIAFHIAMPGSWSQRKRAAHYGQPHRQKPDLDNLLKAVNDALRSDDDSGLWHQSAEKRWAEIGSIVITARNIEIEVKGV